MFILLKARMVQLCERRSPTGEGFSEMGKPQYFVAKREFNFFRNLHTFLKGFWRIFKESRHAYTIFVVAKICKYALSERSQGIFCALRKAANSCHPATS